MRFEFWKENWMLNSLCFFFLCCFPEFFVNVLLCTLDLLAVNGSNITFSLSLCLLARTSAIFYFLYKFSFHSMFLPLIEKEICLFCCLQCSVLFCFLWKKNINVLQKCFNLLLKRKRDFCIVNNCVISTWNNCMSNLSC